ncbi:MAG: methyltransferase domain-containing protein, partial [Candidatus Omnitrophica bacterium]|nr:methyltransferase domain-containing protein [Candidatus Omnitrophota bacterium]
MSGAVGGSLIEQAMVLTVFLDKLQKGGWITKSGSSRFIRTPNAIESHPRFNLAPKTDSRSGCFFGLPMLAISEAANGGTSSSAKKPVIKLKLFGSKDLNQNPIKSSSAVFTNVYLDPKDKETRIFIEEIFNGHNEKAEKYGIIALFDTRSHDLFLLGVFAQRFVPGVELSKDVEQLSEARELLSRQLGQEVTIGTPFRRSLDVRYFSDGLFNEDGLRDQYLFDLLFTYGEEIATSFTELDSYSSGFQQFRVEVKDIAIGIEGELLLRRSASSVDRAGCFFGLPMMGASVEASKPKVILVNLISPHFLARSQPARAVNTLAGYLRSKISDLGVRTIDMQDIFDSNNGNKRDVNERFGIALEEVVEDICQSCSESSAIVGLSMKWETSEVARVIIEESQKRLKDKTPLFVLGNVGATFAYKELLRTPTFRNAVVVVGEGEDAIVEIVNKAQSDIDNFKATRQYAGLPNVAVNINGEVSWVNRKYIDLQAYPWFSEKMAPEIYKPKSKHALETSRGCPWGGCRFCSRMGAWRPFPIEKVLAEIRHFAVQYGVRYFYIIDSEFIGYVKRDEDFEITMKRLEDFADGVIKINEELSLEGEDIIFISHVSVRVDSIYRKGEDVRNQRRRQVLGRLRQAGMRRLYLGIESGSQSQLDRYNKGVSVEDNIEAMRIVRELGFDIEVGFIFFDPLATMQELQENIDFIETTRLYDINARILGSLRVQEGSPYVTLARQEGLLSDKDPDKLSYACSYKHVDVAECERIFSKWEEATRELARHLYDIRDKQKDKKTQAKEVLSLLMEGRKLDFDFLKELVGCYVNGQTDEISEVVDRYISKRREYFAKIKSSLSNGDFVDVDNKLSNYLSQAEKYNNDLGGSSNTPQLGCFFGLPILGASVEAVSPVAQVEHSQKAYAKFGSTIRVLVFFIFGVAISYNAQKRKLRRDLAQCIADGKTGMRVVSVGVGTGLLERELINRYGAQVVGVDLVQPLLKKSAKKGITAVRASGEKLPFADGSFDSVIFAESIGHMDLKTALQEAYRVLAPGGDLHILTYLSDTPLFRSIDYRSYTKSALYSALEEAGFRGYLGISPDENNICYSYIHASKPFVGIVAEPLETQEAELEHSQPQLISTSAACFFGLPFLGASVSYRDVFARDNEPKAPGKIREELTWIDRRLAGIGKREQTLAALIDLLEKDGSIIPRKVFSDAHGNLRRFMQILNHAPLEALLIMLGDYMDRYPDGVKIYEEVRRRVKNEGAIALLGNHDLYPIKIVLGGGDKETLLYWIVNGGLATFRRFEILPVDLDERAFRDRV